LKRSRLAFKQTIRQLAIVQRENSERFHWCGGWDSNPRRPSPQGPKPRAGYDHAFCPLDLALVPPQISEARTTPRPWTNKDYLAAHIATISFPGPSDDKGGSPRVELEQRGAEDNECQELFFLNPDRRRTSPDQ